MATRDLSRAFRQLRADAKAKSLRRKNIVSHAEEGNALMKASADATVVAIAPGWVDVVGETNQHVARIKDMSRFALPDRWCFMVWDVVLTVLRWCCGGGRVQWTS